MKSIESFFVVILYKKLILSGVSKSDTLFKKMSKSCATCHNNFIQVEFSCFLYQVCNAVAMLMKFMCNWEHYRLNTGELLVNEDGL